MKKAELNLVTSIVKKIAKLHEVNAIYLFGSQINGNPTEESDIDLAVLTNKMNRKKELDVIGYSSDKIDISIFNNLPLIIKFRVLKEGKLLYCKSKDELHKVNVEVFKKYLDFSAYINNFYRRIIKNV